MGDDAGHRRLAEAGRAIEQDVVDGFGADFGSVDGELEILLEEGLADVGGKGLGAERSII
jgi:hypothetical protein